LKQQNFWTEFFLVNMTYLVMYTLTLGFIFPVQQIIAAESLATIGLLFLPHGVRAVAFHYLGARAVIHLLPVSYLTWFITVYGNDLKLHPVGPLASVIACYFGHVFFNMVNRIKSDNFITNTWINVLIMSGIMSILNGVALTLLNFDGDFLTGVFGYLIGDISGAFFFMVISLYVYRSIKFFSTNFG
jgi:hypothetical protein